MRNMDRKHKAAMKMMGQVADEMIADPKTKMIGFAYEALIVKADSAYNTAKLTADTLTHK